MLPLDHPDRIQITFDELAQHLGLRELVDHHLDLGNAPGRANPGDKMLTLVASALAGGDAGGTAQTLLRSQGAIHPGDVPAQLPVGPRPPIGSGQPREPGDAPFTIDLDSTICYGGQGGGARPRLHGEEGLSPAVGRGRWHRRRADGPAAEGSGQHRSGCRPLPEGDFATLRFWACLNTRNNHAPTELLAWASFR